MPDATDYLGTPEVRRMLANARGRVREDALMNREPYLGANGRLDHMKIESEVQRQEQALIETLLADLPDEYLSDEELKEREQRRREIPTIYEPEDEDG